MDKTWYVHSLGASNLVEQTGVREPQKNVNRCVINVKEEHGVRDNKGGFRTGWEVRKDFPMSAI